MKFHFQIIAIKLLLASFFLLYSPLESLPVRNLTDDNFFIHLSIQKDIYYKKIPLSDITEIHKTFESKKFFRFLVPLDVYSNWISRGAELKVLPYPKKFIEIDPYLFSRIRKGCIPIRSMLNGYKDATINEMYLNCIAKKYPKRVKKIVIGKSIENRNLTALRIREPGEKNSDRTGVFIHCGIHGNELTAIEHCYDILIEILTHSNAYPFLKHLDLWILPVANPDGLHLFWYRHINAGRANARNVDLNRNFPFRWNSGIKGASSGNPSAYNYRGQSPASEPEVRSLMNLFEIEKFSYAMGIHCYANSILVPYSIPDTINPTPHIAGEIGERLLVGVKSQREDKPFITKKNLYPVDGTDQDSFFHYHGTLAYLLETSHFLEKYVYIPTIMEDIRPAWVNLLKEASSQYQWKIKITDEKGNPIRAIVESSTYKYNENEIRVASDKGFFQEITPNRFPVSVKISYPHHITKNIKVYPKRNSPRQTIVLEKISPADTLP